MLAEDRIRRFVEPILGSCVLHTNNLAICYRDVGRSDFALPFHQDLFYFEPELLGPSTVMLVIWTPFTDCDDEIPGLEIVAYEELLKPSPCGMNLAHSSSILRRTCPINSRSGIRICGAAIASCSKSGPCIARATETSSARAPALTFAFSPKDDIQSRSKAIPGSGLATSPPSRLIARNQSHRPWACFTDIARRSRSLLRHFRVDNSRRPPLVKITPFADTL